MKLNDYILNKLVFLHHEVVVQNNPGKETITAGLGPIGQYGIVLVVFVFVVLYYLFKKKK